MLSTRLIFQYTLQTGRDIFDDFEQLDCHWARQQLGKKNEYGKYLSLILESLDVIGIDVEEVNLDEILKPTLPVEDDEDEDDDFIKNPIDELHARSFTRFPKETVKKCMISFILSKHFDDQLLLDAPYDMALLVYNEAAKEKQKQYKKR